MGMYRNKPVVIEAREVTRESLADVMKWCGGSSRSRLSPIAIETPAGTWRADFGDWIVKDTNGQFRPCKPDIFENTYEEVGNE